MQGSHAVHAKGRVILKRLTTSQPSEKDRTQKCAAEEVFDDNDSSMSTDCRQHPTSVHQSSQWQIPGFSVFSVPMDGNCLFASIAHQLEVSGISEVKRSEDCVRKELVKYVQDNADMHDIIRAGLDDDSTESLEKYFISMNQDGTWGDGNMLAAACRMYAVQLNIFMENNATPIVICGNQSGGTCRYMNIAFVGESLGKEPTHYVSLVPDVQTTTCERSFTKLGSAPKRKKLTPEDKYCAQRIRDKDLANLFVRDALVKMETEWDAMTDGQRDFWKEEPSKKRICTALDTPISQ